jgi:uncharacterized Zn-binding protein involved in type VI secretion
MLAICASLPSGQYADKVAKHQLGQTPCCSERQIQVISGVAKIQGKPAAANEYFIFL